MKQISISFLILIVISLELCTFFISTAFASKTLKGYELAKIDQCEKKFWWKNRKKFQKDLENLCMKQQHDRHDKYKKRFHKSKDCDKSESWNLKNWTNKKNTWENLDQRKCKSLKDNKGHWKKSQKLLWKQFQKLSDCKCSAPNYKVTNPAGISVCYQIASLNKASGSFIGSFTIFRSLKYDKLKGKPASIAVKYDEDIKVKIGRSNKENDGFFSLKPLFTFKVKGSDGNTILVSKAFVEGKLPSKKSMNKICIDDISPIKYKVKVKVGKDTKKVFGLKLGCDVKNIPISKFIPSKPYSPYLIEPPNNPDKKKEPPATTTTTTQTQDQPTTTSQSPDPNQPAPTNTDPNQTAPTNDPNQINPAPTDATPTDPALNQTAPTDATPTDPALNQTAPTDATPTDDPNATNSPNQPDPNPANQNSNQQDTNSISSSASPTAPVANSDSTAAAAADQGVPGSSISTPPIGLIVFAVVVAVGAAFVGYTTYERRRYRNQFNRRQNMQQQNPSLAAVPDFGRAV